MPETASDTVDTSNAFTVVSTVNVVKRRETASSATIQRRNIGTADRHETSEIQR